MLSMYYKKTKRIINVYDVIKNRNGYPMFLVYIDGQWKYESAKHFVPIG